MGLRSISWSCQRGVSPGIPGQKRKSPTEGVAEGDNSTVMIAYVRALGPSMVIQFLEAQNSTNLGFLPISTEEKSSNNYVERHSTVAAASAIS